MQGPGVALAAKHTSIGISEVGGGGGVYKSTLTKFLAHFSRKEKILHLQPKLQHKYSIAIRVSDDLR